jgi:hypothetical protein
LIFVVVVMMMMMMMMLLVTGGCDWVTPCPPFSLSGSIAVEYQTKMVIDLDAAKW